jgi:uncharacterized protein (DUF924 family)
MNTPDISAEDVLTFWFDEAGPKKWYAKDDEFDTLIRTKFSDLIVEIAEEVKRVGSSSWEGSARGALAAVTALDQFPRNIHRGSALSFSYDRIALEIAKRSIASGFDMEVEEYLRKGFYLPFTHSEDLDDQTLCVDYMANRTSDEESVRFAVLHLDVIRDFGCFPHRNDLLGRETTPEQRKFLDEGGFSG